MATTSNELKALQKKYNDALMNCQKNDEERLKLAQELYEIAIKSEESKLCVIERKLHHPEAESQTKCFKLSDPEAALLMMNRFCNIWVPLPIVICMALGCPGALFPPFPPGIPPGTTFCFLINCALNVCTMGNGGMGTLRCVYLCI